MSTPLVTAILIAIALVAFASGPNLRDASLKLARALPNGAATAYASPGLDVGAVTAQGSHNRDVEYILSAPAMSATQMPDGKTMTYSILVDNDGTIDAGSDLLIPSLITQTGAGGAGCAAVSERFSVPLGSARYVGFKAEGSASGDATGASATLEAVF